MITGTATVTPRAHKTPLPPPTLSAALPRGPSHCVCAATRALTASFDARGRVRDSCRALTRGSRQGFRHLLCVTHRAVLAYGRLAARRLYAPFLAAIMAEAELDADEADATPSHVTITLRPSCLRDIGSLATAIRMELEPVRLVLYPQPDRRQVQKWDAFLLEMSERTQLWVDRFCDGECLPLFLESRKVKKVLYVALSISFDEEYRAGAEAGAGSGSGSGSGRSGGSGSGAGVGEVASGSAQSPSSAPKSAGSISSRSR